MEFVCFVWVSEQTANFALNNIKSLVFITELESVYCAVRKHSLYNTDTVLLLFIPCIVLSSLFIDRPMHNTEYNLYKYIYIYFNVVIEKTNLVIFCMVHWSVNKSE
jgi:hypothetical protein